MVVLDEVVGMPPSRYRAAWNVSRKSRGIAEHVGLHDQHAGQVGLQELQTVTSRTCTRAAHGEEVARLLRVRL